MKTRRRIYFVAAAMTVVLFSSTCFAVKEEGFQYWSRAGVGFDINKDWKFTFEEELRLGNDGGNLYHYYSDFGFIYSGLADWIDLGFNYRQVSEKDSEDEWRSENRPHLNVTLKTRLFGLDVSDRSRFEYRDREYKEDVWRYRNKVTVKLPFELTTFKLRPYLADEVFITLNDDNVDRNRLYLGVSFNLAKNVKGEIYYMWQSSRVASGEWNDLNVLGTKLKFSF